MDKHRKISAILAIVMGAFFVYYHNEYSSNTHEGMYETKKIILTTSIVILGCLSTIYSIYFFVLMYKGWVVKSSFNSVKDNASIAKDEVDEDIKKRK